MDTFNITWYIILIIGCVLYLMADTSQRMSDAKKEKPNKKTMQDKLADGIIEKRKVQMYSMSPIIKNKEKSEPLPESKKAIKIVEKEPKEDT